MGCGTSSAAAPAKKPPSAAPKEEERKPVYAYVEEADDEDDGFGVDDSVSARNSKLRKRGWTCSPLHLAAQETRDRRREYAADSESLFADSMSDSSSHRSSNLWSPANQNNAPYNPSRTVNSLSLSPEALCLPPHATRGPHAPHGETMVESIMKAHAESSMSSSTCSDVVSLRSHRLVSFVGDSDQPLLPGRVPATPTGSQATTATSPATQPPKLTFTPAPPHHGSQSSGGSGTVSPRKSRSPSTTSLSRASRGPDTRKRTNARGEQLPRSPLVLVRIATNVRPSDVATSFGSESADGEGDGRLDADMLHELISGSADESVTGMSNVAFPAHHRDDPLNGSSEPRAASPVEGGTIAAEVCAADSGTSSLLESRPSTGSAVRTPPVPYLTLCGAGRREEEVAV